jgi:hypothetical protein
MRMKLNCGDFGISSQADLLSANFEDFCLLIQNGLEGQLPVRPLRRPAAQFRRLTTVGHALPLRRRLFRVSLQISWAHSSLLGQLSYLDISLLEMRQVSRRDLMTLPGFPPRSQATDRWAREQVRRMVVR